MAGTAATWLSWRLARRFSTPAGIRQRFNASITNGQGSMKGQIFRLAHLGYFDFHDLFAVIAELEIILAAHSRSVRFGSGVAAAQAVYAEVALPKPEMALSN